MDNDREKEKNLGKPGNDQDSAQGAGGPVEGETSDPADGSSINSLGSSEEQEEFHELDDIPNWSDELDGAFVGRKDKKTLSRGKKWLIVLGGAMLLLLALTGTYVLAFYSQVRETERVLLDDITFDDSYDVGQSFSENIVNIALLGFDRGWNREAYGEYLFRPDMIAVFSIDFNTDQISVVRIPRDSYVPIHGTGGFHDKINHSYYFGYRRGGENSHMEGIRNTLQTVSHALGDIPIHYFVSVDMYSVIELVDALGGVYYDVDYEIIDKHWEVGRVLVPEGPQIMDGKTFLRYLQYRDDRTGQDYGRIDRQMSLLKESFYYLREQGKITDIPATYRIYKDYVETDLTYTQIASLAYYARDLDLSDDNLHFHTLPGDGQMKDGIWYQVLRQNDRVKIIRDVFGIEVTPWPQIVLRDSPEYLEEQRLKELEEQGNPDNENGFPVFDGIDFFDNEESDEETPVAENPEIVEVLVPNILGMTLDEAKTLIRSRGLVVGEISSRHSDSLAKGLALESVPSSGRGVLPGTVIRIVLSDGPESN